MIHSYTLELGLALLPVLFLALPTLVAATGQRFLHMGQRLVQTARDDWYSTRYRSYGLILLLITAAIITAYYLNNPRPTLYPDSLGYFQVTHTMLTQGKLVDVLRTPVYPLFIALVFLITGAANQEAVSVAQGILFLLATLELYALTILLLRRAWIALGVGLLLGTNIYLLSIVKPVLSEALGLWLVTSLALLVVLFFRRWQMRYLWLVALCTLLLFMTRPEWIYLPVPLFAYLLLIAWRHGKLRRFLPSSLAALALLYVVLGFYIYENGVQNGYMGVTDNQSGNLLGKVLQYHMQNEAPPEYAQVTAIVNAYVEQGGTDPNWLVQRIYPPLGANNWALAGAYSDAIVAHHPLEFLLKTIPIFFTSSTERRLYSFISTQGPFASPLILLQRVSGDSYLGYAFFPLFALFWIIPHFWRSTARLPVVEGMGLLVLLALYGLALTSLGGFVEYTRLHVPFDPMMLVVIWGTLLASLSSCQRFVARQRWQWRTVALIAGALVLGAVVLSVAKSLLAGGLTGALNPQTWLVVEHKLLTLIGLAVVGWLIWQAYRSQRPSSRSVQGPKRPEELSGYAARQTHLAGDQDVALGSGDTGFVETEVQREPRASRTP